MEKVSRFVISFALLSSIPFLWNALNKMDQMLMNIAISIFPTFAILLLTSAIFSHSKNHQINPPLPPGPKPWPIVGNLPELLYNPPGYKWIHSLLQSYATPILCIRLGSVHVIAVDSPSIARAFLKDHDALFASRPITMATEYSSKGFLSVAVVPWGDQWKKMRRVVASELLTASRLNWLHGKRMEEADNLVRWIWNDCKDQPAILNVRYVARHYCGNMIRKLIFNTRYLTDGQGGKEGGGPGLEEDEHLDALFKVLSLLFKMSLSDYLPCLRWLDIEGNEKAMKKAVRIVDKYYNPLIEERFRLRQGCTEEPEDLLDVLISLKDSDGSPLLSLEEIKSLVVDLSYASVDSPSNAVEWALAEMLLQPEIMQKAVEEIDRVVGKDRLIEESDLGKLQYVRACIKESIRMHPVSPFNIPHMSMEDCTVAGYHIPKGSHVLLSRVGLGRNSYVWENPNCFCPDRFLEEDVELGDPELRLISFTRGRRGCMGPVLATYMTVMLLARLLHCFHWSIASPTHAPLKLEESPNELFMATPLHAMASPRLPHNVYP